MLSSTETCHPHAFRKKSYGEKDGEILPQLQEVNLSDSAWGFQTEEDFNSCQTRW